MIKIFVTTSLKLGNLFGLEFVWWGFSQFHKWRWQITHIDLGPVSIYGITHPWMWMPLAWLIKPLRMWYHWRYATPWLKKEGIID